MPAEIRQCPGWWKNLLEVICDACGYRGPTHDLKRSPAESVLLVVERDQHHCSGDDGKPREWA